MPAGSIQGIEGPQCPFQRRVQIGTVLRQGVPGGHLDGLRAALVAAVVQIDRLPAGGEFELPGHGVGDAGDVRQDVPAGPAGQCGGCRDVGFGEFAGLGGNDVGSFVEFGEQCVRCDCGHTAIVADG